MAFNTLFNNKATPLKNLSKNLFIRLFTPGLLY
jgi:hypothetical protein